MHRWVRTTGMLAMLVMVALAALAPSATAAPGLPDPEGQLVRSINAERKARGLPALTRNLQMVRLGRQWATTMAARQRLYHRPDLADAVYGPYRRLGENVGYARVAGASDAELARRIHEAFMASSGHRAHILGRFNQVGVGVVRAGNGGMWVAVNFLLGPRDGFPLYRDTGDSPHRAAVNRLFTKGIVRGCTAHRYCPGQVVTRRTMAVLLDRATGTRNATTFVRDRCGSRSACWNATVTRGYLAMALTDALRLPAASGNRFTDVRGTQATAANAVAAAGIVDGCDASRFCPSANVRRGVLARFVDQALR
ncbi:MAG TPA: CAP domain-containing protein [Egibacteraceae bacterium]|nr:CAP domain-containing protein [Egibacteraceae bacterium]